MSSETIFEYVAFSNSKCYWLGFVVSYQHHYSTRVNETSHAFKCYPNAELSDKK